MLCECGWLPLYECDDVYFMCDLFTTELDIILQQCVPIYKVQKTSRQFPPWFTQSIINDMHVKNNLLKKRKYCPASYQTDVKVLSTIIHKNMRHVFRKYIRNI